MTGLLNRKPSEYGIVVFQSDCFVYLGRGFCSPGCSLKLLENICLPQTANRAQVLMSLRKKKVHLYLSVV